MTSCLLVMIALSAPGQATEDLSVLPADPPPRRLLRDHLLAEAQKHFDARRQVVARLQTAEQIGERQKVLRKRMVELLGGFPERTPLRPQIVETIRKEGYVIDKVIYQSRPGHHVTANFYLPSGKGPFPGVLMPIGHSANGKAAEYVQRGAILLARHGIAVLAYDPIGQGERRQLPDVGGKPALPGSTSEHTMLGVSALLVGWNTATFRIWDGIRSLDYLASRSEIDPKKLGCTGCSGGGTLTSYLMVLDDRIVAAAPSCYITSLERLFATIGPQDAEQNITGQVAAGIEHADYLTMRAPRPTLVCASTRDFFDIQGTWTSFREAKRLYDLLGHSERIDIVESNTGHGFPKTQREAMLRWTLRWLAGRDEAPREEDTAILPDDKLLCTRTGQVLEGLRGISAFGLCMRRARELGEERRARKAKIDVARVIGVTLPIKSAGRRDVGSVKREGYRIDKVVFTTADGMSLPALLFCREKGERDPLVVYVDGAGKAKEAGVGGAIEKLMLSGRRVLAVDLRGLGELAPIEKPTGSNALFGAETRESFLALHLDRPLLGQRVADLLAVVASVAGPRETVEVVATGKAAPVALHAAALEPRIARLTLQRCLVSWEDVVRGGISTDQLANAVPGVLASHDLPELAATLAPRPLIIRDLVDGRGQILKGEDAGRAWAGVRAAYSGAKADDKLDLPGGAK
jgi:cephalosporin-C deacetylase-like acetyl esterase